MKSYLRLGTEVYSDLMLAASVGNLCHLELDLQPFTGVDPFGRVQFKINLPMNLPAYYEWGVTSLSICIPTDARGNRDRLCESASVVDIAPLLQHDFAPPAASCGLLPLTRGPRRLVRPATEPTRTAEPLSSVGNRHRAAPPARDRAATATS